MDEPGGVIEMMIRVEVVRYDPSRPDGDWYTLVWHPANDGEYMLAADRCRADLGDTVMMHPSAFVMSEPRAGYDAAAAANHERLFADVGNADAYVDAVNAAADANLALNPPRPGWNPRMPSLSDPVLRAEAAFEASQVDRKWMRRATWRQLWDLRP
jgi:hypothetical protein